MTYELKRDSVPDEKYEEMKNIVQAYTCAMCQGELTIHTNPEAGTLEVGCINREHHGWQQRTTAVQEYRRAGQLEAYHPDLGRSMNQLALRYPSAIVDRGTAALFITDCMRLGLDPLMQPAEIVPVPFAYHRGRPDEKKIIQEIVTVDGWLSMASRGCPEKWAGAPSIEPVFDEKVAESLSGDKKAWVYKAAGQFILDSGTLSPVSTVYGYFTQAEYQKAKDNHTPAASNPGNQAAIRATKRWVRQNFPDCRQRMMELYREWRQRAKGVKEVEEYIDAEYSLLDEKEPGGKPLVKKGKTTEKQWEKKASEAEGKDGQKEKEAAQTEEVTGEGFTIDLQWLGDAKQTLKWTDDTCKTFLVSQYKVSINGSLEDVISRLTREQAEDFVKQINKKLEKQANLF